MSKRAGAVPAETKECILKAAKNEFLERGFQGSSLRRICSAAGVTTGAVYFFFDGKEDLFKTVIESVMIPFREFMKKHYDSEHEFLKKDSKDNLDGDYEISAVLIDFYFKNKQTWDIVLAHLGYPVVQEFLDGFVEESTEHYLYLLSLADQMNPRKQPIDRFAIHQFVHMQTDTMLTLISHDFTKEEMMLHSKTVTKMLRGAFTTLLSD